MFIFKIPNWTSLMQCSTALFEPCLQKLHCIACKSRSLYVIVRGTLWVLNNSFIGVLSSNFTDAETKVLHIDRHTLKQHLPRVLLSICSFKTLAEAHFPILCFHGQKISYRYFHVEMTILFAGHLCFPVLK